MSSHPQITSVNTDNVHAIVIPAAGSQTSVATIKVNVAYESSTCNPLWCIVFENNDPSSKILEWRDTCEPIDIDLKSYPIYVTHWEEKDGEMQQLEINPE